ncbi:hypothetical protein [Jatrophihabitans sp.]|uniref:hypothetical protein n=1 Tax=Jatrophihabitans sp. TaxID=1932789 RepID=UPI0030C732F0|nr:hypothetical protein [Jatrophihabitans sp.]
MTSGQESVDSFEESALYDSPNEFLPGAADTRDGCIAQSVLPQEDGTYLCACACGRWEAIALDRWQGLALARAHTASS